MMYTSFCRTILCWFQTSLPLAALPYDHRLLFQSCSALALSPSGIAPRRIQLSAICRGGQSGKVIDLSMLRDAGCRLVIPVRQVALAQLNKCDALQQKVPKSPCYKLLVLVYILLLHAPEFNLFYHIKND